MIRRICLPAALMCVALAFGSCSLNSMALRAAADALSGTGSGTVFTGDDDPQLVADALPFAIKAYEALLEQVPDHQALGLTTGSLIVMYANAFVQTQAEMLPDMDYEEQLLQLRRAKLLYLRAFRILTTNREKRFPGFLRSLEEKSYSTTLAKLKKDDVPFLYWTAAAAMAAWSLEPLNLELGNRISMVKDFMARAYELDPGFQNGAIDDFYVSFYAGLPAGLGGDLSLANRHLEIALEKGADKNPSPYISAAMALAVPKQDYPMFKEMLQKALAINPDADPSARLATIIFQRKARYLLDSATSLFISIDSSETEGTNP